MYSTMWYISHFSDKKLDTCRKFDKLSVLTSWDLTDNVFNNNINT